jgi:hypothetical protein
MKIVPARSSSQIAVPATPRVHAWNRGGVGGDPDRRIGAHIRVRYRRPIDQALESSITLLEGISDNAVCPDHPLTAIANCRLRRRQRRWLSFIV